MKLIITFILFALSISALADATQLRELERKDGSTIKILKVGTVTPEKVTYFHDSGVAEIRLADLSPSTISQLNPPAPDLFRHWKDRLKKAEATYAKAKNEGITGTELHFLDLAVQAADADLNLAQGTFIARKDEFGSEALIKYLELTKQGKLAIGMPENFAVMVAKHSYTTHYESGFKILLVRNPKNREPLYTIAIGSNRTIIDINFGS